MDAEHPKLRAHLDVHPTVHEGHQGLVLADPLALSDSQLFLAEGLAPILARLDGTRTLAQLRSEVVGIPDGFLEDLVAQLDQHLLLDSPRFRDTFERTARAFADLTVRPSSHAGSAGYPATEGACRRALERIVRPTEPSAGPPRGLVAPHIDLRRGQAGYAAAYGRLAATEPAELYVIFGTGHQGPSEPVTGLTMDWETPLGTVRTDRIVVDAVHAFVGDPDPRNVYLHRDEHSIEFQVLFLQHLFGDRDFAVAGFLCGALPSATGDPGQEAYCQRLLAVFRECTQSRKVCFIAGADLAHRGPVFGDEAPVDEALLQRLDRDERERLVHLANGEPGAFHRAIEQGQNPDRVCGGVPIFLTASLAGGEAELLHYGQAPADDGSQVVSFCSVAYA